MGETPETLAGMTLNERLYACSLFDRFDTALADRNRPVLRKILIEVEVSDVDGTLDQLLDAWPEIGS